VETVARGRRWPAPRGLIQQALTGFGCNVLCASDGEEALRWLGMRVRAIDLLLTDVVMPGMNGVALGRKVRSELILLISNSAPPPHGEPCR
jgi:CheY-like chemotaxis protein